MDVVNKILGARIGKLVGLAGTEEKGIPRTDFGQTLIIAHLAAARDDDIQAPIARSENGKDSSCRRVGCGCTQGRKGNVCRDRGRYRRGRGASETP